MLTTRIIPCLDIKDNQVVKGVKFKNLTQAGDPFELCQKYYREGADEIVLLDISATIEGRANFAELVNKVANNVFIPITVGGGIRTIDDIRRLLKSGADKISINTAAVLNPDLIKQASQEFGSQAIVVAVDAKQTGSKKWEIYINSGTKATGIKLAEWLRQVEELGAGEVLLTSIDQDGQKSGYDLPLLRVASENSGISIIASGGVGKLADLEKGAKAGANALLAASIFHFGEYSIEQAKHYLDSKNIKVRL